MIDSAVEPVRVRAARHEDIQAVLGVWEQARSEAASTPDDMESVARPIDHTCDGLLVADRDGEVVGALVAGWDGWRGTSTGSRFSRAIAVGASLANSSRLVMSGYARRAHAG